MGDRYFITVICKRCKCKDDNVYYAPTCGFTTWKCPICGLNTDLETYTGITYADASNVKIIEDMVDYIFSTNHNDGMEIDKDS